MNQNESDSLDFNRRDFLKGGSVATLMAMLGGVELIAQTNSTPAETKPAGPRLKVGLIGLGAWGGRDVITALSLNKHAEIAAICDIYPAAIRRCAGSAPGALQTDKYQTILDNKEIKAVIVATPTHQHKEIVLAALKAGKHVYCEAPLALTIEEAREIALAAKAANQLVFQAGLQMRSDKQRRFLLPFIRSGALGKMAMTRAQWHKKQSWRSTSPNPERDKAINWRLSKATSLGLVGEIGIHHLDQAALFNSAKPRAITGYGSIQRWNEDGRDVADTVQAIVEFPSTEAGGTVNTIFDATLANSFDGNYEMFYGDAAAVMLRDNKAWMFKEVDSPLLGWEVYAAKTVFYKETGIALVAGASKSVSNAPPTPEEELQASPLYVALDNFVLNAGDVGGAAESFIASYGADDAAALNEAVAKAMLTRRPAAGFLEGYQATVIAIKANEAVTTAQRIVMKPEWYELG